MKNSWDELTRLGTAVLGCIVFVLGGFDMPLIVLLAFMGIDYLTGVLAAFNNSSPKTEHGGISSAASLKGLIKKFVMLLLVGVATLLDMVTGNTNLIRTGILYCFIANEGISILENAGNMGIWLPAFLKDALEQLKKNNEKSIEVTQTETVQTEYKQTTTNTNTVIEKPPEEPPTFI